VRRAHHIVVELDADADGRSKVPGMDDRLSDELGMHDVDRRHPAVRHGDRRLGALPQVGEQIGRRAPQVTPNVRRRAIGGRTVGQRRLEVGCAGTGHQLPADDVLEQPTHVELVARSLAGEVVRVESFDDTTGGRQYDLEQIKVALSHGTNLPTLIPAAPAARG